MKSQLRLVKQGNACKASINACKASIGLLNKRWQAKQQFIKNEDHEKSEKITKNENHEKRNH